MAGIVEGIEQLFTGSGPGSMALSEEEELFMKARLLHVWVDSKLIELLKRTSNDNGSADLRLQQAALSKILSCPLFDHRREHVSAKLEAFIKALPRFGLADDTANQARLRLRKRFVNLFAGWLARCIRTPAQAALYAQLFRAYGSVSLEQLVGVDPLSALHGEKEDMESGYVRRAFLEMVDVLVDTASRRGGGAYLVACISSAPKTESLPDVFCTAAHITRSTVAQGFYDFYDNARSRGKAMRVYSSIPWRTLLAVTTVTGPRVSAGLIDLVISVSFGGRTLLERLFQWALSIDDTLFELEHVKEELSDKGLAMAAMKMRNIVKENYPMTNARQQLNDRETLDALLVCDIVFPPVDPAIVDRMTADDFATVYAYIMLLLECEDKRQLQSALSKSGAVVEFTQEVVHAVRHAIKELLRTGDVSELIRGIYDALRPVLTGDMPGDKKLWRETCDNSAAELVNCIYAFTRKAVRHSPLIRSTLVWLVETMTPYDTLLDLGKLSQSLSPEQRETLWKQEAKLMVARHKYHDQRGRQAPEDYDALYRLFPPFETWLLGCVRGSENS